MNTVEQFSNTVRTIPDFPKPGIMFKDITPVLRDPKLCAELAALLAAPFRNEQVDVVAGIESRGFLFGMLLAQELNCGFAMIRKSGKLPYKTVSMSYALEYGEATIEMHEDEVGKGQRVLIHDDLLATGGTAAAAAHLVQKVGASVVGFNFLIELGFLNGRTPLAQLGGKVESIITY